jgi:hypothetical protein
LVPKEKSLFCRFLGLKIFKILNNFHLQKRSYENISSSVGAIFLESSNSEISILFLKISITGSTQGLVTSGMGLIRRKIVLIVS